MSSDQMRMPTVAIVGAGMTGILLAIKLREAGITDIVMFEKADKVGGTWRDNRYPGVACDVPAHMYTYSFEPNAEWSKRFAGGHEILQYFESVARKYGIADRIRYGEAVTDAFYERGKWYITTSKRRALTADFLISATGILRAVNKPTLPGMEQFGGQIVHTAQWPEGMDLTGKSVGVIGTGSSATQVVTTLAQQGVDVTVYQRTPQWIFSFPNKEISEEDKQRCRDNPWRPMFFGRFQSFLIEQFGSKAVIGSPVQHRLLSWACKLNLRMSVKDKTLRKKLTPDYKVGCKRLILSDGYYAAVQLPNVTLETSSIVTLNQQGILTEEGGQRRHDVIVMATGFDPFAYMRPMNLVGKHGVHIDDAWRNKISAYRSVNLPDFPNFFLMLGPNSPVGNFSVIAISEVQTRYVTQIIQQWRRRRFDEIAVTPQAVQRFGEYIKAGMGKTVWVSGCQSWYLDQDGDPAMWPYTWKQWVKEMAAPDMDDFRMQHYASGDVVPSVEDTLLDSAL